LLELLSITDAAAKAVNKSGSSQGSRQSGKSQGSQRSGHQQQQDDPLALSQALSDRLAAV